MKQQSFICFLAILVLLSVSCLLVTLPMQEELTLPPLPAYWDGAENYYVRIVTQTIQRTCTAMPGEHISLALDPGIYAIIAVQAQFAYGKTLPLGTMLPWLKGEEGLTVDVWGGFCALLAEKLCKQGYDIRQFNWKRLYELLKTIPDNIWDINLDELAKAIVGKKFRADMITKKVARFPVAIPALIESCYPASPFEPKLPAGKAHTLLLSPGNHIWYTQSSLLIVQVDSAGRYTVFY